MNNEQRNYQEAMKRAEQRELLKKKTTAPPVKPPPEPMTDEAYQISFAKRNHPNKQ